MISTFVVKFPKIKRRFIFKSLALSVLLICLTIVILFSDGPFVVVAIIIMLISVLWLDYLTYSREDPIPYLADSLTFDINDITIGSDVFVLKELKNIKITINKFDGETFTGRGRRILNGTNNRLSFVCRDKVISISFYLDSEYQKNQFKVLFESWYESGVIFYEGDDAGKTYLLDKLNYREIQEFKVRYKLN